MEKMRRYRFNNNNKGVFVILPYQTSILTVNRLNLWSRDQTRMGCKPRGPNPKKINGRDDS
jgi:hypothetical protein